MRPERALLRCSSLVPQQRMSAARRLLICAELAPVEALALPTFEHAARSCCRRVTLLTHDHRIVRVFYLVATAARNPSRVLAWMQSQGWYMQAPFVSAGSDVACVPAPASAGAED